MKKCITLISIRPVSLTHQNTYIINSLDVFKDSDIVLKQDMTKKLEPYIAIKCNIQLTESKGNELKKKLKSLLNAANVNFEITEM